jgi:hypothetical protein
MFLWSLGSGAIGGMLFMQSGILFCQMVAAGRAKCNVGFLFLAVVLIQSPPSLMLTLPGSLR